MNVNTINKSSSEVMVDDSSMFQATKTQEHINSFELIWHDVANGHQNKLHFSSTKVMQWAIFDMP